MYLTESTKSYSETNTTEYSRVYEGDDDCEYVPVTNNKTIPLTIQTSTVDTVGNVIYKIMLHPKHRLKSSPRHPIFNSPFSQLDYYQLEYRWSKEKAFGTTIFARRIFRSLKDLEFQFADEAIYRHAVLPYIEKTRRYRICGQHNRDYVIIKNLTNENLQCKMLTDDGKARWINVAVSLLDISAKMGVGSLMDYGSTTGLEMSDKGNFSSKDKSHIDDFYDDVERFDGYAKGDVVNVRKLDGKEVCTLQHIDYAVDDHVNKIAIMLGVQPLAPSESWGYSTGSIVARLITKAIAKIAGVTIEQLDVLTQHGGATNLLHLGRFLKKKDNFIYLTMVDGGRANNERLMLPGSQINTAQFVNRKVKGVYTGVLCDIDISGCYANGLMNQIFPIGIPQVISKSMSWGTFVEEILPKLVPGCWSARFNYENAPFEDDLTISKIPEAYTDWDFGIDGFDNEDFSYESSDDKTYDAGMLVTTHSKHQAILTHDLLQIYQSVATKPTVGRKGRKANGNTEWEWLCNNATITGVIYYDKALRVDKVTDKMLASTDLSANDNVVVSGSKEWVGIELSEILKILIPERAKAKRIYGKKSSEQTFLKLINNTIFGCIASVFFNKEGTSISNVVVGNNITARARALGWLMAKGLGAFQIITDGGVFDLNNVVHWKKISLDNLARLYYDKNYDDSRNITYTKQSLLGREVNDELMKDYKGWRSQEREDSDFNDVFNQKYLQDDIDVKAWNHLQNQFSGIDILNQNQFVFESKRICLGLTPHNKVNYRLSNIIAGDDEGEEYLIALRGMNRVSNDKGKKIVNPDANFLFDSYEEGRATGMCTISTKLLSLADWKMYKSSDPEKYNRLLPDDQVSDNKVFYSITPLNYRFTNLEEYIQVQKKYQDAKKDGDPVKVASISVDKESFITATNRLRKLTR